MNKIIPTQSDTDAAEEVWAFYDWAKPNEDNLEKAAEIIAKHTSSETAMLRKKLHIMETALNSVLGTSFEEHSCGSTFRQWEKCLAFAQNALDSSRKLYDAPRHLKDVIEALKDPNITKVKFYER